MNKITSAEEIAGYGVKAIIAELVGPAVLVVYLIVCQILELL